MKQHKVSYKVVPAQGRWRTSILVDEDYEVDHRWFDSKPQAESWGQQRVGELVREGMRG